MKFLQQQFTEDFKGKLAGYTVREASKEIGISASTVSRITASSPCDLPTYGKVCAWLKKSPADYFQKAEAGSVSQLIRVLHVVLHNLIDLNSQISRPHWVAKIREEQDFLDKIK